MIHHLDSFDPEHLSILVNDSTRDDDDHDWSFELSIGFQY